MISICLRAEVKPLHLKDALEVAERQNPDLRAAEERLQEEAASLREAFSQLGLEVNAGLDFERRKDAVAGGRARFNGKSFNLYAVDIEARQRLFRKGSIAGIQSARAAQEVAEFEFQIKRNEILLEVLRSFEHVSRKTRELQLLEETLGIYEKNLAFTLERQRIGESRKLDVLQLRSEIALLKPQIDRTRNEQKVAREDLQRLLNLDSESQWSTDAEMKIPDLNSILQRLNSEELSFDVKRAQANLRQQKKQRQFLMGEHWPELEAVGRFGRAGEESSDLFDADANEWSVGLELNIPLFSSLSSLAVNERLRSLERQKTYELESTVQKVRFDQSKSKSDLESNIKILKMTQEARDVVKAALVEARRQFRLSGIDYYQLLDSERRLLEVERSFLESKSLLISSLADIFSSFSMPVDELAYWLEVGEVKANEN